MRAITVCAFVLAAAAFAAFSPPSGARADDSVPWRHAIAMHGEPKYAAGFTHFDYINPDAPKGGVTRRAGLGSFDSFNPFILKGDAAAAAGSIYDTLMTEAADEPFSYYGLLAESIQTPADRSWAAFRLREGARWHDGKPVTPDDVVWTFNALVEKGHPQYRYYYGSVTGVRKTGPRTVRFDFCPGSNLDLPLLLGQMPVLPKHYWAARDFEKLTLERPLGSGPYRIGKFEAGRYVELERVEDYWGADLPVSRGFNNYDRIRYDYYRDTNIALEAFKGGEYDLRAENSSKAWTTAEDSVPWRHAIAMHGEPKYGPGFTHFDYINPDAPKGGVTRRAGLGSFDSFNPFILKGDAAAAAGSIYDTLMTEAADEPFSYYGLLAESIQTPADRSWAAFRLRKEARWHDGKPVTPDDVVWTFNALVEKGHPQYRYYYGSVTGVRKTGPRTVRFDFCPGGNLELPLILGQMPVLPKHYWAARDFEKSTLKPPLGSGPYRIGKFEAGRYVELKRAEDYWGADLPVSRGFSNYDRIRYDYYRDTNVALEAFKSGEYDLRAENSSKAWATAYDFPAARKGWVVQSTFEDHLPSGMQAYAFNLRREKFRSPQVRRALAAAFDFEWSNKNLFYGQYKHTRSFFDHSELAATGLPSKAELALLEPLRGQIPADVFSREYNPPKTDGSGRLRANLREAGKILDAAGWMLKDGKRIDPQTGAPLEFEFLLVSPLFERITLPVTQNLKKLGVIATVRTVDPSQYQHLLDTFDFDVVVASWGQTLSPGNEQREFWGSAAAGQPGSRNVVGIQDPAVDALIEHVIAAENRDALVTAVRALDRVLQWNHFVIPQWHAGYQRIARWDIFGMPETVPLRGVQTGAWWIIPEKQKALSKQLKSAQE